MQGRRVYYCYPPCDVDAQILFCFAMGSRRKDNFSVAGFFLKLVWQNGRPKRIWMLQWLGEENKQKKMQRSICVRIIFQCVSITHNESDDLLVSVLSERSLWTSLLSLLSSKFLQNLSLHLTRFFSCLIWELLLVHICVQTMYFHLFFAFLNWATQNRNQKLLIVITVFG